MTYNEENLVVVQVSPQTNEVVETEMAGDRFQDAAQAAPDAFTAPRPHS